MYEAVSVWLANGVSVSLPSYRFLVVLASGTEMFVNDGLVGRLLVVRGGPRRRTRRGPSRSGLRTSPRTSGRRVWTRDSFDGVIADHASSLNVVRNEPLNVFPPDFVIAFTTPPVKRPTSAEIADVDVVVSWIASSMKRLYGVPRMLSTMTAPLTVKRLSKDCAPEIVNAPFGPFWLTPGESATAERIVRPVGSVSSCVPVYVVAAWFDDEIVSALATTSACAATELTLMLASSDLLCAPSSLIFCVTVAKDASEKTTV